MYCFSPKQNANLSSQEYAQPFAIAPSEETEKIKWKNTIVPVSYCYVADRT